MVIQTKNLHKHFILQTKAKGFGASVKSIFAPQYRRVEAVQGINLSIEQGESVAFLGPNGAGKSTTIKMLTGILHRSGGSVSVLGFDPDRDRTKLAFHIGTVFGQKSQLWYHLPAMDSFRLLGAVYEVEPRDLERRIGYFIERFSLREFIDIPVRKLSLGQRIRCEIAASLLHNPRLLFLDEPTIGLDVVAKQEIRGLLEEWNKDNAMTLFLTSHDIGDVEKLCNRAVLIHHGTLVLDEPVKVLKHQASARKIIGIRYRDPVNTWIPGLEASKTNGAAAKFEIDTSVHKLQSVIQQLVGLGEVLDLTIEDEPLENIIASMYRSTSKEAVNEMVAGKN